MVIVSIVLDMSEVKRIGRKLDKSGLSSFGIGKIPAGFHKEDIPRVFYR